MAFCAPGDLCRRDSVCPHQNSTSGAMSHHSDDGARPTSRRRRRRSSVVAAWIVVAMTSSAEVSAATARAQDEVDPCLHPPKVTFPEPDPAYPSTYAPPAGLNTTSFVVLAAPRSASEEFVHTLNSNDCVQAQGEVFHYQNIPGKFGSDFGGGPWSVETRDQNRTDFMAALFAQDDPPAKRGALARGFKAFSPHLSRDEFRVLTRSPRVLKIVLRRQDTLAQYVSRLRAIEWGNWHRPDAEQADAYAETKVAVCVDAYLAWLGDQNSWYEWLAQEARVHPETWLFISTEQLLRDPYTMRAVYDHLKVPGGAPMPEYEPYSSDGLEAKVVNYDEIKDLEHDVVDTKWRRRRH
mmetsp:Transcript_25702/g.102551  ORF Transcript_25702/g.102551 Transcript_25702/m.102551 type:complete len:351 (+) Transcript_25702:50-1102(+)